MGADLRLLAVARPTSPARSTRSRGARTSSSSPRASTAGSCWAARPPTRSPRPTRPSCVSGRSWMVDTTPATATPGSRGISTGCSTSSGGPTASSRRWTSAACGPAPTSGRARAARRPCSTWRNETGGELFKDANNLRQPLERVLERTSVTYLLTFERVGPEAGRRLPPPAGQGQAAAGRPHDRTGPATTRRARSRTSTPWRRACWPRTASRAPRPAATST